MKLISLARLAAICLASPSLLLAQQEPTKQPEARPAPQAERPGAAMTGRLGAVGERLLSVLTEEQRDSLRTAMEKQREKGRELEEKLRDARRELLTAAFTDKFDEQVVRDKAMAVAKIEVEQTVIRAKAVSEISPALSAEQLEQLRNPPSADNPERAGTPRRPNVPRDENGLPVKTEPAKP
jgi:Spy/CpxP family protein refolding chaperone